MQWLCECSATEPVVPYQNLLSAAYSSTAPEVNARNWCFFSPLLITSFFSSQALLKGFLEAKSLRLSFMLTVIFKIQTFLVFVGGGGTFFGIFLKRAICLRTAAGWRPNLAAISAVLTPSSAQHAILIFSPSEISRFRPISI